MPRIRFIRPPSEVTVPAGTPLLAAARKAGIAIKTPCNQIGVCGKCRVRLSPDDGHKISCSDRSALSAEQQKQGWYPACHTLVNHDLEVLEVPEQKQSNTSVLQAGRSSHLPLSPLLSKRFSPKKNTTLVFSEEKILGREPGDTTAMLYGLSVDIGTTTVVTGLVDLLTGHEIDALSEHNPQSEFAHDVLSRITFAGRPEGLQTLQKALIDTLNAMISRLAHTADIGIEHIYELVFSGNTCMLHLATGHPPKALGRYPYTPLICGHESIPAADLGLQISPFGQVYLPPILSAFVGADITSGILSLQLHKLSGISLFVDIGTNGEIVLSNNGRLTATSTAAGPALEGMNISCGMFAGPGAVERVAANGDGKITFKTIGNRPAVGLCGSGLIDLIAVLLNIGIIEPSGRFTTDESKYLKVGRRPEQNSGSRAFALTPQVNLSQKDVRQVQLAKGAIQAGIDFLLKHTGIRPDQVNRVLIAGAFGYHLETDSLSALQILPAGFKDKVEYVGNTSKTGGQAFLTHCPSRREMAQLASKVDIVELSGHEDFERHFVRCMRF